MDAFTEWSQKRLKNYSVITKFIEEEITRAQAAEMTGLSERQVTRIAKEMRTLGAEALLHKNKGRSPANSINHKMEEIILQTHSRPEYQGINFLHFRDVLAERHDIKCSYATVYSILNKAGKVSPKKQKRRKLHKRRERKEHMGELLQIDASPYDWFSNGQMCSLHGAIDDASNTIVGLYFCTNECRLGYFEVMRQCVLTYGAPLSIYSDNHTIFRSPKAKKLTIEEQLDGNTVKLTQFGRAMHDLGTNIIFAKSPQAKGRVERMWETLQSRLPVELALDGITTIDAANEYLIKNFIPYFNEKWKVDAKGSSFFVPLRKDVDVDLILCVKELRSTDNAGVFSCHGSMFQILDEGFPLVPKGKKIEVFIGLRIGIKIRYQGRIFSAVEYLKPLRKDASTKITPKIPKRTLPHLKHSSPQWQKIWHSENYNLSLKFLFELFLDKEDIVEQFKKSNHI